MKEVSKLITSDGQPKMVVLSAMSGTTNTLVEISDYLYKKNPEGANTIINRLEQKYIRHAQEIYNTIDIREDEVVPLFRKAREIADIPTMRILTDAYRIICKNRPIKNALPPPESECVSNEEFRNAFKQAKELVGGKKNV
jgi:hypothetical protein